MEIFDLENTLIIELATGDVVIELFEDVAPLHAERLKIVARAEAYDNVAFHRVIDGFVAQTGDISFGNLELNYDPDRVGTGGSILPDLPLEASDIPFERGIVGMARASDPNSANTQFFINFDAAPNLNGQFTVVGQVVRGMEFVDQIKRGDPLNNGAVTDPDRMIDVNVAIDELGQGATQAEALGVALLYEVGLDRDGQLDFEGYNFWVDVFEGGTPVDDIAQSFLVSAEFELNYGNVDSLTDLQLVEQFYFNVLDRAGEQGGVDFWVGQLGRDDFDRADLLVAFAFSEEFADSAPFEGTLTETFPGEWQLI